MNSISIIALLGLANCIPYRPELKKLYPYVAGGIRAILTDQNKLVVAVGGVTALAAGVYTTR